MQLITGILKALAFGFLAGFLLGWFVKKAIKIALFTAIALAIVVAVGLYQGWLKSEWFAWVSVPEFSMSETKGLGMLVSLFLSNLPFGIAALIGFLLGLKKG